MGHRRDIDGLRAFAIVPVVCFHAGLGLRGGFVGVDIFFVISGYLISSILFRDGAAGRASILGFYDRRIRRIFPALAVVLVATTAASLFILLPSELIGYAHSLLYAVLFSSNIWFWATTNYFGDPNIDIPLLHTWSLAVEEQFYILWPLVVLVLAKLPRRLTLAVVLAALVVSLLLSQWLTVKSPTTAFYMLPSRAWELLIGATLALLPAAGVRHRRWLGAAGVLGLALICYAVTVFYETMPFPGFAALVPCLGTALLLYAGAADGPATRLLSWRPLVAIGLISYSLYLWHWPILSLSQLWLGHALTLAEKLAAVALSVVLAGLSWRYVEQPFRHTRDRSRAAQWRTAAVGLATIAAFAAVGGGLAAANGLRQRLPALALTYDDAGRSFPNGKLPGCVLVDAAAAARLDATCFADAHPQPTAVLWGDSHALQVKDALAALLAARGGTALRSVTVNGCAPFAGAVQLDQVGDANNACAAFNDRMLATIAARPEIREVYISGRWGKFLGLASSGINNGYLRRDPHAPRNSTTSRSAFIVSVDTMVATLQRAGKTVTIIGPSPEFATSVSKCMARQAWSGHDYARCDADLGARPEIIEGNRILRAIAAARHAHYVDLLKRLCTGLHCATGRGNTLFFRDENHLTTAGARFGMAATLD
jgi:peptidoglycan/LPS O-acetylase OafA/YrhL